MNEQSASLRLSNKETVSMKKNTVLKTVREKTTKQAEEVPKTSQLLIFICVILFWAPAIYQYDLPQLFEGILIKELNVTTIEIQSLYSLTTAPAIIPLLFIGSLVSVFGLGMTVTLSSFIFYIGLLLCHIGVYRKSFLYLGAGRVVYGIGEEFLFALLMTAVEKWFSGRYLSIGIGLNTVLSFLGRSYASYLQPALFLKYRSMEVVTFSYSLIGMVCIVVSLGYFFLEWKNEKYLVEEKTGEGENYMSYQATFGDFLRGSWLMRLSAIFVPILFPGIIFSISGISTDLLTQKYFFGYEEAKNMSAIIPLSSVFATFLFSWLATKFGKKAYILMFSAIMLVMTFIALLYIPPKYKKLVYIPFSLIGIPIGMCNVVIWTNVTLTSPKQLSSIVIGTAVSGSCIGLSVFPFFLGLITVNRNVKAYDGALYFLLILSFIGLIFTLVILVLDLNGERVLDIPENEEIVTQIRVKWSKELFWEKVPGDNRNDRCSISTNSARKYDRLIEVEVL